MRVGTSAGVAIATGVAALALAASAAADTYVVTTRNDPPLEVCEVDDCSLREAVDSANAHPGPDRVVLPDAGRYQLKELGSDLGNRHGDLDVLDGALRVIHPGEGRATIDHNPPDDGFPDPFDRIFEVNAAASLKLKKLVITDGGDPTGSAHGGGILAHGDLTLTRTLVTGNEAPGSGGGVEAGPGVTLDLRRSKVTRNRAVLDGGGIHQTSPGAATPGFLAIARSTIAGNRAVGGDGGGLFYSTGQVNSAITESTISGNRAGGEGGGIYAHQGLLTIVGVTVSGNEAGAMGGGMSVAGSSLLGIVNSTFAENDSHGVGGGIHAEGDVNANSISVTHNLADADADGDGAGKRAVSFFGGGGLYKGASAEFAVENSLIALNNRGTGEADDCAGSGAFDSQGNNLLSTFFGCSGFAAPEGDIEKANPRIGELADNGGPTQTVALLEGSAAIGAANPATSPPRDQRGRERRDPDIGAFERR